MYHGYCIRRAGDAPPASDLVGVDGARVESLRDDVLGLWVSAGDASRPTPGRLREHDRVVRSALRTATPLPLRYGAVFRDEAEVTRLLAERRDEFVSSLDRLANRIEMGLRVRRLEPATQPPYERPARTGVSEGPGRTYLEERKRILEPERSKEREALEVLDDIEMEMNDMRLPTVRTVGPHGFVLGSLAHLLHREDVSRYRERASVLQSTRPTLRIEVTGPWAPYSFA